MRDEPLVVDIEEDAIPSKGRRTSNTMVNCGVLCGTMLCQRGDDDDDIIRTDPRPGFDWLAKEDDVEVLQKDVFGFTVPKSARLAIEYNRLIWTYHDEKRFGKEINGRAQIHGNVRTLHGEATAVLELVFEETTVLVLKFATLDVMNDWWIALLATQQLQRKLDHERGIDDSEAYEDLLDDDDDDDDTRRKDGGYQLLPGANEKKTNLSRGTFEPAVFLAIRRAYEQVLGLIIRPPRAKYTMEKLGPRKFFFGGGFVVRDDFTIFNPRGLRLRVSLWRPGASESNYSMSGSYGALAEDALAATFPQAFFKGASTEEGGLNDNEDEETNAKPQSGLPPTVVYIHGNASCRVESLSVLALCLGLGLAVCAVDCAGSGQSDGEYVSLGYYEAEDAVAVVDYLKSAYGLERYALWGRSMGAVTALLYASEKAPDAACVIADSPFASIKRLCYDLVHKVTRRVPDGATLLAVRKIRRSVKYRTQFDMYKCNPDIHVKACKTPALLIHGNDDDFIRPSHSERIKNNYGGHCVVLTPTGNHNSKRPLDVYTKIEQFLCATLCSDQHATFDPNDMKKTHTLLDFRNFYHPEVPNPYLLPAWFFRTTQRPDGSRAVEPHPRFFADAYRHKTTSSEFVSGMSDDRQRQAEAAVGNLFGAPAHAAQ